LRQVVEAEGGGLFGVPRLVEEMALLAVDVPWQVPVALGAVVRQEQRTFEVEAAGLFSSCQEVYEISSVAGRAQMYHVAFLVE